MYDEGCLLVEFMYSWFSIFGTLMKDVYPCNYYYVLDYNVVFLINKKKKTDFAWISGNIQQFWALFFVVVICVLDCD